MRKRTVLIFFCLILTLQPIFVASGESPLFLQHKLTGYLPGEDGVSLDYNLLIENMIDSSVYNLTIRNISLLIKGSKNLTLTIGDLSGHETREINFRLHTPMMLTEDKFSQQLLSWIVEYQDENELPHEVLLESHPLLLLNELGGAQ